MALFYGDLHIHIGSTNSGAPVKITASRTLTLERITQTAKGQKGLDLVGIVDAACSGVLQDLQSLHELGQLKPIVGGGALLNGVTLFLGSEVELVHQDTGKEAHFLAYFADLASIQGYAAALKPHVTNPSLSTQRLRVSPVNWLKLVKEFEGVAIAAHAFTPHKGVYGSCVKRLEEMLSEPSQVSALELGLSANTEMALAVSDTHPYAYLANSDAHSLQNIGREFTVYNLPELNFGAWRSALEDGGRGIWATHGLEPRLGKYYRSWCPRCERLADHETPTFECPYCKDPMVPGVWDRLQSISDHPQVTPAKPPYTAHVPLRLLPGIGPKMYAKLIGEVGTEMDVLYRLPLDEIAAKVGSVIADQIAAVRAGSLSFLPGGGGKYGRVTKGLKR